MEKIQIRQGDVLLHPVPRIPRGAREVARDDCLVLAEGEATGHAHTITAPKRALQVFQATDTELYLKINEPVVLAHQEHAEITVPPGQYVVRRQVEQWLDEVRQVMD